MSGKKPYFATQGPDEDQGFSIPDWREVLAILLERAWIGVAVAAAVLLYFWYDASRQIPYYRSTASLLVEAQAPQMFSFQDIVSFNTRNLEYFNTHIKALHSRRMMETAMASSGLSTHPDFTPGIEPGPPQVDVALRYVTINPVERSRMIEISVEHPVPVMAADLANAMARSYIQQDLDNRMSASMQAVEWLRARADEYREKLEAGLLELQQYREQTQSVSLEEDQNIVIAKLKALNVALTEAQTERITAETQWRSLHERQEQGASLMELASLIKDPVLQDAHRLWREKERELEAVRQRYRPGHPDYQLVQEEEARLKAQYEREGERALRAMRSHYELLADRERSLEQALRQQEQESFELDRKLVRYNDLKRNIEAEEKIYQAVIARMQEASLSGTLPTELIRLVEEAVPARAPFRPNHRRALVRGSAMGLLLGLAAVFGLYYADHRLRRSEEIERILSLPVLGTLPLIHSKLLHERGLSAHLDDTGEVAEAFRTLRAGLMMDANTRAAKCWMVTSAHAGEGKSLVATNLAVSLAQDGQKTLLIGADLRRPSLHKLFQVQPEHGLVDVLKGESRWQDALLSNDVPGLDILSAGKIPSRPAELLGSGKWPKFLEDVKQVYERIIIDAPPILGVGDSLVLLPHVERVLFVVRYAVTHSASARYAARKIEASGTTCSGVILNGVNLRSMANYYYYRRYGDYSYKETKGARD